MAELKLKEKLDKVLKDIFGEAVDFDIEKPANRSFGDFATNAAMKLAKEMKKPPLEIADQIAKKLGKDDLIEKVEIKAPGFINFFIKKDYYIKELDQIISKNERYGESNIGDGKKVVLEHTNVNPNKALHVGHLRNSCLGNSCEKILEFSGYDVEAQYYVDDTGVQVAVTLLGLKKLDLKKKENEKFDHFAQRVYVAAQSAIEKDKTLEKEQKEIISSLDKQEGTDAVEAKDLATKVICANLETMHNLNIDYDLLVWESDILNEGFWQKAFNILKRNSKFIKAEKGKNAGCWVIQNVMGDDKVIVKSNGVATYTGKDIAYHLWKFNLLNKDFNYNLWPNNLQKKKLYTTSTNGQESLKFGRADIVTNFIDVRQTFAQEAVKESFKILGYEKEASSLFHIGYGIVFLSPKTAKALGVDVTDKKSRYPMSGRLGIGILADDLSSLLKENIKKDHSSSPSLDEIALGAIKYHMLKYNTYSDIVFDYEQALSLYGNTGPYLQYSYARCQSILKKAGKKYNNMTKYDNINEEETQILQTLIQFPEVVKEAAQNYSPNIICNYLHELAKSFNTFYSKHTVLSEKNPEEVKNFRLLLTAATAIVLKNGLNLLGIPAPEKM